VVPSRTRVHTLGPGCCGVGEELSEDGVGDAAFEAAQGFEGFLSFGALATVVGLPVGGGP
jgi:hypothetical protein